MQKIFINKNSIILFVFSLLAQFISAQPTQAEIDKMIKDAKAESEKLKKDPKTAEMSKNLPKMDSLMKNMQKGNTQAALKNIKTGSVSTTLPVRNNKLLGSLPKRNLIRQELVSFLTLLYSDLQKKLPADKVKSALILHLLTVT